jgi:hypothetical protein
LAKKDDDNYYVGKDNDDLASMAMKDHDNNNAMKYGTA